VFGICASCELQTLHYRIVFIVFVFTLLKTLFLFISLIFSFLIKFLTVFPLCTVLCFNVVCYTLPFCSLIVCSNFCRHCEIKFILLSACQGLDLNTCKQFQQQEPHIVSATGPYILK